ncbi:hypothetical protein TA3x_002838 [Tundrisphaera sp. TA3]|uniref:hypothetical protein n=1 Tax=Tundrisphaera sp. TA3 TaxID=3435775 RepID=UPI003EBCC42B
MSEHRGDHLIEIGDPNDDTVPGPIAGPHVVIEYRDRGLPWMLVLPLLVTAAAVAVIGYKAFEIKVRPVHAVPETLLAEAATPPPQILPERPILDPIAPAPAPPSPVALPADQLPPVVEPDPAPPQPAPTAPATSEPAAAPDPPKPADVVEASPDPAPAAPATPEPAAPLASAPAFGFDLDALEKAEIKPPAAEPAAPQPAAPQVAELPKAIDPDVLPRDPRQAELERYRRFLAERRRRDEERTRFHADLRALVRRFGKDGGAQIADLCRRYGFEPDPVARAQAKASRVLSLGAAGVDQKLRIKELRSIGWPEAGILLDLTSHQGKWEDGTSRNGPKSYHQILSRCANVLLAYPPRPVSPSSARASGPSSAPAGRR